MSVSQIKQKIGIFGGTFDPLHNGHLAVAQATLSHCQLDRLLFIPAPYPPHKNKPLTSFSHRIAMLEAGLADEPKMAISLLEAERQSPSYTVDTLLEFYQRVGDHTYYLIIGADSFLEVHLWYRYTELFRLANIVVAARPGVSRGNVVEQVHSIPGHFLPDPARENTWRNEDNWSVTYLEDIHVALSSSSVRQLLREGKEVKELLPSKVFDYIYSNKLYGVS